MSFCEGLLQWIALLVCLYIYTNQKKQHVPIPIQIYSTKHEETDLTGNVDFILQLQDKTRCERKNKVKEQR